ncbi:MAG: polyprenyl synthetase family protein [Candidatus Omnitrophica bacterium]|nr:polyprenyl synthetase family protein [Candidatus Omnitrophota bacterium]
MGRAFQIKDDIIGIFSSEEEIGKPNLTDIKEGKITLLIWQAFRNTNNKNRAIIKNILAKNNANRNDLLALRKVIAGSGALETAKKEINDLILRGNKILVGLKMSARYKESLDGYINELLNS